MKLNSYFHSNLKYLRTKKNMEQLELAQLLGRKSASSVSEWEKGMYTPKSGVLSDIAKIFSVSLSDLMDKDLANESFNPSPTFVKIPVIGKIACGDPVDCEENIEDYIYELAEGLPAGELYSLIADGNSMSPTIASGSKVVIKKQETVDDGQIAAVRFRETNEITLKRVRRQGNVMLLIPDNRDYETIIVTHDNPADIVGRAIRVTADL